MATDSKTTYLNRKTQKTVIFLLVRYFEMYIGFALQNSAESAEKLARVIVSNLLCPLSDLVQCYHHCYLPLQVAPESLCLGLH